MKDLFRCGDIMRLKEKPIMLPLLDEGQNGKDPYGLDPMISGLWGHWGEDIRLYFGIVDILGVESFFVAREDLAQYISMMIARASANSSRKAMVYFVKLNEKEANIISSLMLKQKRYEAFDVLSQISSFEPYMARGMNLASDEKVYKQMKLLMGLERDESVKETLGVLNYNRFKEW